jgi:hypothetical protein
MARPLRRVRERNLTWPLASRVAFDCQAIRDHIPHWRCTALALRTQAGPSVSGDADDLSYVESQHLPSHGLPRFLLSLWTKLPTHNGGHALPECERVRVRSFDLKAANGRRRSPLRMKAACPNSDVADPHRVEVCPTLAHRVARDVGFSSGGSDDFGQSKPPRPLRSAAVVIVVRTGVSALRAEFRTRRRRRRDRGGRRRQGLPSSPGSR